MSDDFQSPPLTIVGTLKCVTPERYAELLHAEYERDALRAENERLREMLAGCYAKWREDADPLECGQLCADIDAALAAGTKEGK